MNAGVKAATLYWHRRRMAWEANDKLFCTGAPNRNRLVAYSLCRSLFGSCVAHMGFTISEAGVGLAYEVLRNVADAASFF